MSDHRLGPRGELLIKSFEQLRLTAYKPTRDDVWTVGWGSTKGVREGMTISIDEAQLRFLADIGDAVYRVNSLPCALTQSMFDALVSLVFNVGPGAIKAGSTIGNALQSKIRLPFDPKTAALAPTPDYFAAWAGFALWRKQAGKNLLGLARRRAKEMDLWWQDGLP